jgi:hypothetical protein
VSNGGRSQVWCCVVCCVCVFKGNERMWQLR